MNIKTFIMACGLAVCLLAQPAVAGPLEDGKAAYDSKDYATAIKLLRPLAEQGLAGPQVALGAMYYESKGVPLDHSEAVKWYRKAADQGVALAQGDLGIMYFNGDGVPQDYVQAHMWFNLAAAGSSASDIKTRDAAAKHSDEVAAKMTPEQIAEAQRLAQEWLAAHPKK